MQTTGGCIQQGISRRECRFVRMSNVYFSVASTLTFCFLCSDRHPRLITSTHCRTYEMEDYKYLSSTTLVRSIDLELKPCTATAHSYCSPTCIQIATIMDFVHRSIWKLMVTFHNSVFWLLFDPCFPARWCCTSIKQLTISSAQRWRTHVPFSWIFPFWQ